MNKKLIYLSIIILFTISCGNDKPNSESFVIKGKISNYKGGALVLEELKTKEVKTIDSIIPNKEGIFSIKVNAIGPSIYLLKKDRNNFISLICNAKEEITINADINNLSSSYSVSGSPDSELLYELNNKLMTKLIIVDSLRKEIKKLQHSPNFRKEKARIDTIYNNLFDEQQAYVFDFIEKNNTSLASIMALYQSFGQMRVVDENKNFEVFEKLSKSLIIALPKNEHAINLNKSILAVKAQKEQKALANKKLGIGSVAPDISLQNPEGVTVKLSSLRGKIVLLDFWASWCGPCRRENPNLKRIYSLYKDKGFEIYGVALDRSKQAWINAINKDGLPWTQVSDLQYWNSPAAKLYNISSIPYSYLLDKEGKIIAKGLRGHEIEAKLKEIL